jgi:anti-anti-sigma regulatory factor
MLRISVESGPLTTRFKLEGKLAHQWVGEASKAWAELVKANGKKKVIVDLFDVEFVDDSGEHLLLEMSQAGARLVGSGPMISPLIQEIEGSHAPSADGKAQTEVRKGTER